MIEELIIFSFLGVFVGLVAGMFGIGGGTLIVPVLVASFLVDNYLIKKRIEEEANEKDK